MKYLRFFKPLGILSLFTALSSCGVPTAAVRTYKNALKEVTAISDGSSSAYKDVN